MEKRFVAFMLVSLMVIMSYSLLMQTLAPPPRQIARDDVPLENQNIEDPTQGELKKGVDVASNLEVEPVTPKVEDTRPEIDAAPPISPTQNVLPRMFTLGSADKDSPYRLLVHLNNRGAALERATLNSPKYRDLDVKRGYLGDLNLVDDEKRDGCRVQIVGPGTPAALAVSNHAGISPGLRGPAFITGESGKTLLESPGDLITGIDGQAIANRAEFLNHVKARRRGAKLQLAVERTEKDETTQHVFTITLGARPLDVLDSRRSGTEDYPASFLFSLTQLGEKEAGFGKTELSGLPSLRDSLWSSKKLVDDDGECVEFRLVLGESDIQSIGQQGAIELVKRYRLTKVPADQQDNPYYESYDLSLEWEIHNHGTQLQQVAYSIDGPTGLTDEGWWYSYKARDVAFALEGGNQQVFAGGKIYKQAKKRGDSRDTFLFSGQQPGPLKYIGCDHQYFAAVMLPHGTDDARGDLIYDKIVARTVVEPEALDNVKRTDVSFRMASEAKSIQPGGVFRQSFEIFIGPKQTDLLARYGLEDLIVYGWFGGVSRPMLGILHFFYNIVRNYGLAIILLTVLVRGCMFPLGRKMAMNAQKMQELAPEMKKIADKYKSDMEKRTQAQRDLFRKHNYNPAAGCLPMLLQLPIFIGLYRGLSVDIALRQAPLIPGLAWCSNLAGPDMLLYWENLLPAFLASPSGWLGPYLNILPLVTCVLFIVHQKLFTPPPTDDQQRMQQQIMKFMMLFMAVLFFKVASGLCVYFVASSIWGLGERLLLPKSKKDDTPAAASAPAKKVVARTSGNGSDKSAAAKKRKKRQRNK